MHPKRELGWFLLGVAAGHASRYLIDVYLLYLEVHREPEL